MVGSAVRQGSGVRLRFASPKNNSSVITSHFHMYLDPRINYLVYRTTAGLFILYQQSNLFPEFSTYSANVVLAPWYNIVAIVRHALALPCLHIATYEDDSSPSFKLSPAKALRRP
jgi:hypothetical protein